MNHQKGITLIITFLMMTIMLSIVMGVSTILLREISLVSNAGNSIAAFDAARSGLEKTLYLAKFQAGSGGLCSICKACTSGDCLNCTQTAFDDGSCKVTYDSVFDGKTYQVDATIMGGKTTVNVKGFYRDSMRQINYSK